MRREQGEEERREYRVEPEAPGVGEWRRSEHAGGRAANPRNVDDGSGEEQETTIPPAWFHLRQRPGLVVHQLGREDTPPQLSAKQWGDRQTHWNIAGVQQERGEGSLKR